MSIEVYANIVSLVKNFLEKKISVQIFESDFLKLKRLLGNQAVELNSKASEAIDRIFSAVDRFYPGPNRDEVDLTEHQLFEEVKKWSQFL